MIIGKTSVGCNYSRPKTSNIRQEIDVVQVKIFLFSVYKNE